MISIKMKRRHLLSTVSAVIGASILVLYYTSFSQIVDKQKSSVFHYADIPFLITKIENLSDVQNHIQKEAPTDLLPAVSNKRWLDGTDMKYFDKYYDYLIHNTRVTNTSAVSCVIPSLDPYDPQVRKFIKWRGPLNCKNQHPLTNVWNESYVRINSTAAKLYYKASASSNCQVQFFKRQSEKEISFMKPIDLKSGTGVKIPNSYQYIYSHCGTSKGKKGINSMKFSGYWNMHYRLVEPPVIKQKRKIQEKVPRRGLSVIMFMLDGVSHLSARRFLKKTYYYLLDKQGGLPLNGFHTVGLNTFPNMIPYLTGHRYQELGNFRSKPFDVLNWPFIWKNFSGQGYITGYAEDATYSTFNYLKKGFKNPPTDYYHKVYINFMEKIAGKNLCISGKGLHKKMLDLLGQFIDHHTYESYYYWHFLNAYSHSGDIKISQADQDYYHFFKSRFEAGHFNNTLILIGSDHGARFGRIRQTSVGRAEERLPLNMLVFPPWFKEERKELYDTLQGNADRLTTHFDMHEMLVDVLNDRKQPPTHKRDKNGRLKRGLSLFGQIPLSRTCEDAAIPPAFCVCRRLKKLEIGDSRVKVVAIKAVSHLNNLLKNHKKICEQLNLNSVITAHITDGQTQTLQAGGNLFHDIMVVFQTVPGNGQFEANVRLYQKSLKAVVVGPVSRINLYGDTSQCIKDNLLRNYCYCKSNKHMR